MLFYKTKMTYAAFRMMNILYWNIILYRSFFFSLEKSAWCNLCQMGLLSILTFTVTKEFAALSITLNFVIWNLCDLGNLLLERWKGYIDRR